MSADMPYTRGTSVYHYLLGVKERNGAGFIVLLDPDRSSLNDAVEQAKRCGDAGVDALLIGTSLMMRDGFGDYVASIREAVDIPVIIFPGDSGQVTREADAIFFLSLLSGRNPEYIIGEQVKSAPIIRSLDIEAISIAYLLIESGRVTSVEFMSGTKPIPADKPEITLSHAMVAEIFGMKLLYLEAGSGGARPVPDDMIETVVKGVKLPVIVGGGIRNPDTVAGKITAGASFVVVGNHLEDNCRADIGKFVEAAHRAAGMI